MRIISGKFRGRRLECPKLVTRPTLDRVREALFSILGDVSGLCVVDLYAGSGALGLEALSRGARHVTFVEQDRRAAALIRENVASCDATADYTVETGDVATLLRRHRAAFDLIWLDPPYDGDSSEALAAAAGALAADGLVVLERATRRQPGVPDSLARIRDVKSGDSSLTFFTLA